MTRADRPHPLPEVAHEAAARADARHRVVLDLGRRRSAPHPGLHRVRHARAPAGADLPELPAAGRGSRPRCRAGPRSSACTVNAHQWLPDMAPPYVDRGGRPGRERRRAAHHQHRGLRPGRRAASARRSQVRFEQHDDVWLPMFEPTGEVDDTDPVGEPDAARAPARAVEPTGSSTARCCRASGARRSAGGSWSTRCRSPSTRAWRRSPTPGSTLDDIDGLSTYPGAGGHGHERGRGHRGRGGAAPAPHVDQRRRRPPRPGRLGHRRDAGRVERAVPPRPVLPHGVGVDLRDAAPGRWRPAAAAWAGPRGGSSGGPRSAPCRRPTGSA